MGTCYFIIFFISEAIYTTIYMCGSFCLVVDHEGQFPNVAFLAKQIIGISGFQIEIEKVFILVGVLIVLRCFRLQGKNLDRIISRFEVALVEENYEFI
jgi:hypothetical protein